MSLYNNLIVRPFVFLKGDKRLKAFKKIKKNQKIDYQTMRSYQFGKIIELLNFAYENVPFYKYWFDKHNVNVKNIKSWDDFNNQVPILTKKDIVSNIELFEFKTDIKFNHFTTGGSTGQPLKYKVSKEDNLIGNAIFFRGVSYGGFSLGNKLLMFGGGSLFSSTKIKWTEKLSMLIFRTYRFSSYGVTDKDLYNILMVIKFKKIKFITGYASSVFMLADYARKNKIEINLKSVFLTAEMLYEKQRQVIETVFSCEVFDDYGLNDGGVSAYEMRGFGKIVDMERAYMEIEYNPENTEGRILATQFHNYVFPFIRYDTGDIGQICYDFVDEYPYRPRLVKLLGRQTEYLIINEKKISSPALTVLMGKTNIEQYKIVQRGKNYIEINIKKAEKWTDNDEKIIRKSFNDMCGEFRLDLNFVDVFINENKHKFIVREYEEIL